MSAIVTPTVTIAGRADARQPMVMVARGGLIWTPIAQASGVWEPLTSDAVWLALPNSAGSMFP